MSRRSEISAEVFLATRAPGMASHGLVTFTVIVPRFVWLELLTHKRIARNAASARAMGTQRLLDLGYYAPEVFYTVGEGMQSGKAPIDKQTQAQAVWEATWKFCESAASELEKLGVSKEQRNRVLPTFGMIRGFMTATEDGWKKFLALRLSPAADVAMQEFSFFIQRGLHNLVWNESAMHVPYWDLERAPTTLEGDDDYYRICMARIARISYNREGRGRQDLELGNQLLAAGHWSPAEHIAMWKPAPRASAVCSKPEDTLTTSNGVFGWENYRAFLGA